MSVGTTNNDLAFTTIPGPEKLVDLLRTKWHGSSMSRDSRLYATVTAKSCLPKSICEARAQPS